MTKLTPASKLKIFNSIVKLLGSMNLLQGITILYDNKRVMFDWYTLIPTIEEGKQATDYCEYSNNDTLTITFDGGNLWDVMNQSYGIEEYDKLDAELSKILKPHNLHYEMGHSWSLSLYFY
jgi:hypothetical protein